jgi:hypothetical protein
MQRANLVPRCTMKYSAAAKADALQIFAEELTVLVGSKVE